MLYQQVICMKQERIDKILAGTGLYSRSEARTLVQSGVVTVDGVPVRKPEVKISRDSSVSVRGEGIETAEFVYYMMNKPALYISAAKDEKYPAVTNLLPRHLQNRGLFPVGRLDVDVTGLLILTDDGAFAHRVTAPKSEIPKTYEVWIDGKLRPQDVDELADGVTLDNGTVYKPAKLVIDPADPSHAWITVTEGKFHEVKNLLSWCGCPVVKMRRLSIGGVQLDDALREGEFRPMTEAEAMSCFAQNV